MNAMKKPLAFLLALVLLLACLPLGTVPVFAAEVDETQPPKGIRIGDLPGDSLCPAAQLPHHQ